MQAQDGLVVQAVVGIPCKVLIMNPGAFTPFTWTQTSINAVVERHEGNTPPIQQQQDSIAGWGGLGAAMDPMIVWER